MLLLVLEIFLVGLLSEGALIIVTLVVMDAVPKSKLGSALAITTSSSQLGNVIVYSIDSGPSLSLATLSRFKNFCSTFCFHASWLKERKFDNRSSCKEIIQVMVTN